ncbi:MAG: type pilus assembly protein PilM [Solirubrobacterales bacterium]|jgi:type IV pilus assembly protein PilM|nr:type pilus assembly protein PilM [Solirubrobacterales bacterium]
MKLSLKKPTLSLSARSKDSSLVGLEIEAGSIAAAEVQSNGDSRVTAAAVQALPPEAFSDGEVVDPDAMAEALRSLFAANKLAKRVRLGIANQRVVVRTVRLPAIEDPAELDAAVRFSAQEQIAMPLEQAVIDHRVIGGVGAIEGAPPQVDVMVVAARRDMISASLKPLKDAGLEPLGVDLSAFGMIRAFGGGPTTATDETDVAQPPAAVLFCNVGDVTNLAVAKGRSCLFTRVSSAGLDDMVTSLASKTQLTPEHARMWLEHAGLSQPIEQIEGDPALLAEARATLERGADSLLDELRLSLDFYGAQEAAVPVDRVVLCGLGSAIPGLRERLEPGLGLPMSIGQPEALAGLDAATAARLTLPYGLALDQ